jgi:hypothetical protein
MMAKWVTVVTRWLAVQDTEWCQQGTGRLVCRWDKCFNCGRQRCAEGFNYGIKGSNHQPVQRVQQLQNTTVQVIEYNSTTVIEFNSTTVIEYSSTTVIQFNSTTVIEYNSTTVIEYTALD